MQPQSQYDPSASRFQSLPPQSSAMFLTSINVPLDYSHPNISIPVNEPAGSSKRRHWVITRSLTRRGRERDDDSDLPEVSDLQALREARAVDFGSFAPLAGALDEEMRRQGIIPQESDIEARTSDIIRQSLDSEAAAHKNCATAGSSETSGLGTSGYWNSQRAAAAEEYVRDLVYGGVDGLAYIRSLAEFVTAEVRAIFPVI